jgi:hypothetical protein
MNAGKNLGAALAQAKANAAHTNTNRYVWRYNGVYWVEKDRPNGAFGTFTYTEVRPDGTCEDKETTLEQEAVTKHTIQLGYNEEIEVILPDGQKVSILLSYLEPGAQLPEIDIKFPSTVTVNCFLDGLRPAMRTEHGAHILEARQIIVPIPPIESR